MPAAGVILAGGSGTRMGASGNKVYAPLAGRPLIIFSIEAFLAAGVDTIVVVTRTRDLALARDLIARETEQPVALISGGPTRHASELAALLHLAPAIERGELDVVAIHDGARPVVSADLIATVLRVASDRGGAVPTLPVNDLVFQHDRQPVSHTGAGEVIRVQTPQAFQAAPLLDAYRAAEVAGFDGSDTASCLELFSTLPVFQVPGENRNVKVTFTQDLCVAAQFLATDPPRRR